MRFLLISAFWLMTQSAYAEETVLGQICGLMDLTKSSDEFITGAFSSFDLIHRQTVHRSQCGLRGLNLPVCTSCQEEPLRDEDFARLRSMLAKPSHVQWHFQWHSLRAFPEKISAEKFAQYQKDGVVSANLTAEQFKTRHAVGGSLSGEDFLFMHRQMLRMVQIQLASMGLPCVAPWASLPQTIDDPAWPVQKAVANPKIKARLIQEHDQLLREQAKLRNPELLRKISLNRLGQRIEAGLHLGLHDHYRSMPPCSPDSQAEGLCDDLVPFETSLLNKHFWKLHGLVDEILADWAEANGFKQIPWGDVWIGKTPVD